MPTYTTTDDGNIIKQSATVESEIHLDKLEKQITDLTEEIENLPALIVCPEDAKQEIKDLVEEHNSMLPDRTDLENQLKEKRDLLTILKNL